MSERPLVGLSGATLGDRQLASARRGTSIGIVHFGIGAFHRAHQAVYTDEAMSLSGERRWGILGVTGRRADVAGQLAPQDGLFSVLERSAHEPPTARVVMSVLDVAVPALDARRIVATVAAPTTHVVTITVTEKGYAQGVDDLAVVAAALAGRERTGGSGSWLALLAAGLVSRSLVDCAPISVLSCDNLPANGAVTEALVRTLIAEVGLNDPSTARASTRVLAWMDANVTFPSTVVDRIVPATTPADRLQVENLVGMRDAAVVVAEPFSQWVIEDRFAGPRPAWELAGATFTPDVTPYERAKLRVLNGSHSMIAYLGSLRGYETIAAAIADPHIFELVYDTVTTDVLPTLVPLPGLPLEVYRDTVLERFGNSALGHTTRQVAMDGSRKLPGRILAAAQERVSDGHTPRGLALALAAWIAYIGTASSPAGAGLDDPRAPELTAAVGDWRGRGTRAAVTRIMSLDGLVPEQLRHARAFTDEVVAHLVSLSDPAFGRG